MTSPSDGDGRTGAPATSDAPDVARPSDHVDQPAPRPGASVTQPRLGPVGWLRFAWRQLTSMRTALLLLLLLAIAAVPGSLVPQRSSDPNGVTQYFVDNPDLAPVLDTFQMFDVYSSVWFSAIYLLLFTSLIGCVIPRTKHHLDALRARPPKTPARLSRLAGFTERRAPGTAAAAVDEAERMLRQSGYRVERYDVGDVASVSAERGYLRETGNLVFHSALVGILVTVAVGGGYGFAGQRVVVEGQSFVNTLASYDSFNPGRFFDDGTLDPYRLGLDDLAVVYETENVDALGQPVDFTASVTVQARAGEPEPGEVKVNAPLRAHGTDIFLLGNGYAPTITVRDADGEVVFTDAVPFLPQDANLTSLGVVKVPDGLDEQLGMIAFFYPTQDVLTTGAYTSTYPDLFFPVLTLNVYSGDLGIDDGVPTSVYALDTDDMTQLTGGDTGVDSIELAPGESAELPNGLGTVEFVDASPAGTAEGDTSQSVLRFASFDIHHDPTQGWVLVFALLALGGLMTSLFIPRRRVWVKATDATEPRGADGDASTGTVRLEYAGLARGDDPGLADAVAELADRHSGALGGGSAQDSDSVRAGART
ncbi:cytochrome c biogenesis protein ResB [Agromyces mangrovi Wang et al. 2018]|nr:cytochrome c biogenesis protein ResB [Agromyces mangrovi]